VARGPGCDWLDHMAFGRWTGGGNRSKSMTFHKLKALALLYAKKCEAQ